MVPVVRVTLQFAEGDCLEAEVELDSRGQLPMRHVMRARRVYVAGGEVCSVPADKVFVLQDEHVTPPPQLLRVVYRELDRRRLPGALPRVGRTVSRG